MTPAQEKNYRQGQLEISEMSERHRVIRIKGDHSVFFTKEKNKTVIDALNSML